MIAAYGTKNAELYQRPDRWRRSRWLGLLRPAGGDGGGNSGDGMGGMEDDMKVRQLIRLLERMPPDRMIDGAFKTVAAFPVANILRAARKNPRVKRG